MVAENPHRTPQSLSDQWEECKLRLPADAPQIVVDIARQAFYAGAQSSLLSITNALAQMHPIGTKRHLRKLHDEIRAYAASVASGG